MVTPAAEEVLTLSSVQQSGEMVEGVVFALLSALRGCKRSGDRARRSKGEPGSALRRPKPFLPEPGVRDAPGE